MGAAVRRGRTQSHNPSEQVTTWTEIAGILATLISLVSGFALTIWKISSLTTFVRLRIETLDNRQSATDQVAKEQAVELGRQGRVIERHDSQIAHLEQFCTR